MRGCTCSLLHVSFERRGSYSKTRNNEGVKMAALIGTYMNKGPMFNTLNTKLPETKHICKSVVHFVVKYIF